MTLHPEISLTLNAINFAGVRSRLEVDRNHLRAYHNAVVVCVNESAWDKNASADMVGNEVRSFDLGDVQVTSQLRLLNYAVTSPI